ncbi:hypothetical protein M0R89_01685 [Halorussus limi]|uniref:Uncharacterized protein n=1 Tax=Halorussus limi TaxID=2938695 RepID=A0A8U0HVZ8_9EURY|nr:hypothetical protein [Halorussus limi]UPV74794.1 hypothetical protein M0R89_01685 [Halorussus limi]
MSGFRFECAYCDELVVSESVDAVKANAEAHLEAHRDEMRDVFTVAFGGTDCQNECGYVFPEDVDEEVGFECRACGHDNFPPFVTQYVYWRIEKTESVDTPRSETDSDDDR